VWLFQLSRDQQQVATTAVGETVRVGDVDVTVHGTAQGQVLAVQMTLGGVDDLDGINSFRLVTGEVDLPPLGAPSEGRCISITVEPQTCALEFEVQADDAPNLVLVMRRGEDVARWDGLR
jgi:hypothetical protein